MAPERESPYWKEIVQDNWPEIPPGDWSALEATARDGAAALDTLGAEQARKDFENRVRVSEGLQPIKDDMLRQRGAPQAFADALDLAADTFGQFAGLVHRTRNYILDIVERATERIRNAQQAAANAQSEDDSEADREAKAAALQNRIDRIIAEARDEVDDVARAAVKSIRPTTFPTLEPFFDPRSHGRPRVSDDGPGHRPAHPHPHPPGPRHDIGHPGQGPNHRVPVPLGLGPQFDVPVLNPHDPRLPGSEPTELPVDSPPRGTPTDVPTAPGMPPMVSAPTSNPGVAPGYLPAAQSDGAGPGVASPTDAPTHAPSAATGPDASQGRTAAHADSASGTTDSRQHGESDTAATDSGHGIDHSDTAREAAATNSATQIPPMPPTILPPAAGSAGISAAAASTGPQLSGQTSAPSAQSPAAQSRPPAQAMESKAPQVDARGSAAPAAKISAGPTAPVPSAAPTAKPNSPQRDPQAVDGRPGTGGSDELIRDVVGGAMAAAAAPTFMLGERVDGDLVLARTILGGVLAAVDSAVVGLEWAVSVMRHSGGINAFVTSNEGRSWLPAGLHLPREISTPWMWEVADAAWEGVADPARVLAEFGAAWGHRTGARVTAIVSSGPIDAGMRAQLREVPMEGPVSASSAMDLSTAAAGLADRLGLVAAPQMLDRVAQVPVQSLGSRCVDLAWDAHRRVGRAGAPDSLGLPGLRQRIMAAIRQRKEVPADWWEELRDADDLLAASMLSHRADVSRVALGELRSDTADGRSASEAMLLRAMVFERRCDELVLLLADEPNRQRLRDAVYAHGQIVDHPLFVETPRADAGTSAARRPTITAGPTH